MAYYRAFPYSLCIVSLAFLGALFPCAALAQGGKLLGQFGSWAAFEADVPGGKVCYMVASPDKSEGAYAKRGEVRAFITHRPSEGARDVFSYEAGYTYKADSVATITIDKQNFPLFTNENMAWAKDAKADAALAKALQSGKNMVVQGFSFRGTQTKDTFGLSGSGKAYATISKACETQ